ncbi:hypothetical protein RHMOL_Rhmol01G0127800 [Rhododendron molle]|uniref:Uncharacterized protein n=1 Tax=Rhododendron molle TaxID=49168 RepID=A0ACC0Q3H7_RHOML|nr:hypothetical protein RHMOL_Rhmol01G0127800 [Rhododendron molle]
MASSSSTNNTSTTTATSSPMDQKYPYPTEFNVRDFVPIELSRRNYDNWSRLMSDFIQSRGLIGFIRGTVKAPALDAIDGGGESGGNQDYYYNNSNYELWKRSDNFVRGWILATLAQDTRLSVLRFKTAEAVWNELRKMFDLTMNLYGYQDMPSPLPIKLPSQRPKKPPAITRLQTQKQCGSERSNGEQQEILMEKGEGKLDLKAGIDPSPPAAHIRV